MKSNLLCRGLDGAKWFTRMQETLKDTPNPLLFSSLHHVGTIIITRNVKPPYYRGLNKREKFYCNRLVFLKILLLLSKYKTPICEFHCTRVGEWNQFKNIPLPHSLAVTLVSVFLSSILRFIVSLFQKNYPITI
jgi:hypothetical protein